MAKIRVITFNVRGLSDATKRRQIFNFIHNKQIDIALLQETHSIKAVETHW